ncbi:MAG: glycosyltransferase family 4 protein [Actinobacteria bacterium]|nr:MAG: glycosyltransferase family 4 protein [Actinomycetota bacterium]
MRILICSFYFPPSGGGGVQRPLRFARQLPEFGIETHILTPGDSKWIHRDEPTTGIPERFIHRTRYIGPRGRLPAEELYGLNGLPRLLKKAALTPRRFVLPDENAPWLLTAIPSLLRVVKSEGIDTVLTTSPPNSVHFLGPVAKRLAGVRWVADIRDSIVASHERAVERLSVRAKEHTQQYVVRAIARHADAISAVTEQIAAEMRSAGAGCPISVIPNGADFDDFQTLEYRRTERFRITHTGSFFGKRDPRPFLTALAQVEDDVIACFVGDFRSADAKWMRDVGLGDRVELEAFVPRRRALELQRHSDALLLLLPNVGDRGVDVPSGKIYEYLAARRPILAAVPPDGAAARLVREADAGIVSDPDDVDALRAALETLIRRWKAGELPDVSFQPEFEERISRSGRAAELADLLRGLR